MNPSLRPKQILGLVALLVVSTLSIGCAEANFELADDSRIPVWFKVPEGQTRADVSVSVAFYIVGRPTLQGDFVLRDRSGRTIAKATGDKRNTHGGITFPDLMIGDRRRMFDVITVDGRSEVFEYQRGRLIEDQGRYEVFLAVCDEPEIRKRLGVPNYEKSHASQ